MQPLRGIALKLLSVCLFMIMAGFIKATAQHVPAGERVFFRAIFAIPVIVVWLTLRGDLRRGLITKNPLGHFWRGLMGTTAMGLSFVGLGLLPLPEVTAIGYAAPLFVVILAAVFLNEQVRAVRVTAVAMGMVGVLIVLSPRLTFGDNHNSTETLGAVLVLGSAIFGAISQIVVRKLTYTENTASIVFWFSVTSSVLALFTLPWGWVVPNGREIAMLVASGLLGGVGQIFLTTSYRYADAGVIAPFDYASMLLALLMGYFIFDEVPTGTMLLGASIVIAAGVLIIWRERALGLARDKQRKVTGVGG